MAAQWLEALEARGLAYASKVKFELPTETRVTLVKGRFEYITVASRTYEGEIIDLHQYQLTVFVPSENKNIVLHPDMVTPLNVVATLLRKGR